MSQYRHLPIYKAAYDLLQAVTRATAGFPRAWKYSFGDKLRAEALELVVLISEHSVRRVNGLTKTSKPAERGFFIAQNKAIDYESATRVTLGKISA